MRGQEREGSERKTGHRRKGRRTVGRKGRTVGRKEDRGQRGREGKKEVKRKR